MGKYITTSRFAGEKPLAIGSLIELTPEQAASPFYSRRVRKADEAAPLEGTASAAAIIADAERKAKEYLDESKALIDSDAQHIIKSAKDQAEVILDDARKAAEEIKAKAAETAPAGTLTPATPAAGKTSKANAS